MGDDLLSAGFHIVVQADHRVNRFAPAFVRYADDRTLDDGIVLIECIFDLGGIDASPPLITMSFIRSTMKTKPFSSI